MWYGGSCFARACVLLSQGGLAEKNPYFPLYLHDSPVNVSFYFSKYRDVPSSSRCGIFEILSSYQKCGGVRLDNGDREKTFAFQLRVKGWFILTAAKSSVAVGPAVAAPGGDAFSRQGAAVEV